MANIATCRCAAAAWQALMILLVRHLSRGQGHGLAHIVLCKKVPAEVRSTYNSRAAS